MKALSLVEIANVFIEADRLGAEIDVPEGSRYILLTDTLLNQVIFSLGVANGQMLNLEAQVAEID